MRRSRKITISELTIFNFKFPKKDLRIFILKKRETIKKISSDLREKVLLIC
jgi:hypothetical protein